jgi:hypothetical protein
MKSTFVLLSTLLAGACAEPEVDPALESEDPVPDETEFFETAVQIHPDGTSTVSEPRVITARKQRAQNRARAAFDPNEVDIFQDGACSQDGVWLYSRPDFTGSRICFTGYGHVWLDELYRYHRSGGRLIPIGTWGLTEGSFVPGVFQGTLTDKKRWGITTWIETWLPNGPSGSFVNRPTSSGALFTYHPD